MIASLAKDGPSRLAHLPRRNDLSLLLRQLRGPARVSAVRAVVDGLVVIWVLRQRGVRSLLRTVHHEGMSDDATRAARVAEAVDAGLSVVPVARTCLRRSVTLVRELHRLGLAGAIHIGVRNAGDRVEAHAWVQVGDVVVNDDPAVTGTYVELAAGELERVLPSLP